MTMIGYISVIGEIAELQSPPAANPLLEEEEFQKLRENIVRGILSEPEAAPIKSLD